jgi:hypothetical protein
VPFSAAALAVTVSTLMVCSHRAACAIVGDADQIIHA